MVFEVIRTFLFFFYKKILQAEKSIKSKKKHKNIHKQISDFLKHKTLNKRLSLRCSL